MSAASHGATRSSSIRAVLLADLSDERGAAEVNTPDARLHKSAVGRGAAADGVQLHEGFISREQNTCWTQVELRSERAHEYIHSI